jgi:hypothetical protein
MRGSGDLLSCRHSLASVRQNSASESQCSASFWARMARSQDMISNFSNWYLVVMSTSNRCHQSNRLVIIAQLTMS